MTVEKPLNVFKLYKNPTYVCERSRVKGSVDDRNTCCTIVPGQAWNKLVIIVPK